MRQITFIGFGEIGGALARLIEARANIRAWDKNPSKVIGGVRSLEEAVQGAEALFLCVPSTVIRQVASDIAHSLEPETVVISLAKGLEASSLKTMDVVLAESLKPNQPSGVLGGPLLAEELEEGLPGIGVIGAKDVRVFQVTQTLFSGTSLRLEYMNDSTAVALSSVLKNVYAVVLGIADGLGWGWNAKGWLAAQSLQEMRRIAQLLGQDMDVVNGSAGVGDFFATSCSSGSFNRETGRQIALTGTCATSSEGCHSVAAILSLIDPPPEDLPLLLALNQILNAQKNPKDVFQFLLTETAF